MALKLAWHEQVTTDASLNHLACRVASVILHRLSRDGDCFPSLEYIARAVGTFNADSKNKGRSTIQRALRELVERGHLEIFSGRFNSTGRRLPNVYVPRLKSTQAEDEPRGAVTVTSSRGHEISAGSGSSDRMKCADRPHEVRELTSSCGTNPYKNPLDNPSRARSALKGLGRVEPSWTTEPPDNPVLPRPSSVPIPLAKHLGRMSLPEPREPEVDAYASPEQWTSLRARLQGGT